MRVAVLRFPGSNCDQDALHSLRDDLGFDADYLWHGETSVAGFDAVFVPGGFSYGDYLRCGAMAARSPVMGAVREFAAKGGPVIGACNGFQILCESGLLPGALLANGEGRFTCRNVELVRESTKGPWMTEVPERISLPIAHGEGRYAADEETLDRLEGEGRVAFRYADNPNGSARAIAGVLNERGNVIGLMPHPERATRATLGGTDGRFLLNALAFSRV